MTHFCLLCTDRNQIPFVGSYEGVENHIKSYHDVEIPHSQDICSLRLTTQVSDPINPLHYKGRQVMDIINMFQLGFCLGNVVKYILREQNKCGLEDLKKAKWYLEEEIRKREEGKNV